MRKFDIARIFDFDLAFLWCEMPSDEEFKQTIKESCKCIGSFVMATFPTTITPIVGSIPYVAHWETDYLVIGNVADGYAIDKEYFEKLYNDVQNYISELLSNATYIGFNESEFQKKVIEYIKAQHKNWYEMGNSYSFIVHHFNICINTFDNILHNTTKNGINPYCDKLGDGINITTWYINW